MYKTIKQHISHVSDIDQLLELNREINAFKTYIGSRYNGIHSLDKIARHRKLIRDKLVNKPEMINSKLQGRHFRACIDDVIGNIKTNWVLAKKDIKKAIKNNENLNEEDRHYLYYVLKVDKYYRGILERKDIELTKEFKVDRKRLDNLLRRYTYRCHRKPPKYANSKTITLTDDMYRYSKGQLRIMGSTKGKPIVLNIKETNELKGTVKLVIYDKDHIEVHGVIEIKPKVHTDYVNEIGIDKGYSSLIATSTEREYGTNLGTLLSKETERLSEKNKKRNRIRQQVKDLIQEGNLVKARRIEENNLGTVKYSNQYRRSKEYIKSYINYSINQFLQEEKPREIILEDLTWIGKKKPYKGVNRKLSSWCKGYIDKRIQYKSEYNSVELTYINPAYTSQICSKCGRKGTRNNKIFTCSKCSKSDADINAAKNILMRKKDTRISKYTSAKEVAILLGIV